MAKDAGVYTVAGVACRRVLVLLAEIGVVHNGVDTVMQEKRAVAHARQFQGVRRAKSAGVQKHFLVGADGVVCPVDVENDAAGYGCA